MNRSLLIILTLTATLFSCKKEGVQNELPAALPIRFSASLEEFDTKVTGNNFDNGDKVGLFVYNSELNYQNLCYKKNQYGWLSDQDYMWHKNHEEEAFVFAYYPYNDSAIESYPSGDYLYFCVQEDQSINGLEESDILYASTSTRPTGQIGLTFYHLMSRVNIDISNPAGIPIDDVFVSGVSPSIFLGLNNMRDESKLQLYLPGEANISIRAKQINIDDSSSEYAAICAPGSISPKIHIIVGDQQMIFRFEETITLSSGRSYTAHINIDSNTFSVEIGGAIANWYNQGSYSLVQ